MPMERTTAHDSIHKADSNRELSLDPVGTGYNQVGEEA